VHTLVILVLVAISTHTQQNVMTRIVFWGVLHTYWKPYYYLVCRPYQVLSVQSWFPNNLPLLGGPIDDEGLHYDDTDVSSEEVVVMIPVHYPNHPDEKSEDKRNRVRLFPGIRTPTELAVTGIAQIPTPKHEIVPFEMVCLVDRIV
jgi:hypothetical protein